MSDSAPRNPPDSHDVWSRLDLHAGQLPSQVKRRMALAAVGLIAAMVAAGCLIYSGAVVPRISAIQYGWDGSLRIGLRPWEPTPGPKKIYTTAILVNESWFPVTIVDIGGDMPGLRLDHLTRYGVGQRPDGVFAVGQWPLPDPLVIEPGREYPIQIHYEVIDCMAVPTAPQLIPVNLARPWGRQTVHVQLPPLRAADGGWRITTHADPHRIEWQRLLADDACGTRWEVNNHGVAVQPLAPL